MQYRVICQCGESITVGEGAAGSQVTCPRGHALRIPSLRELVRQSGLPELETAPELEIEALLLAGKLPEERHCVLCGGTTDQIVHCRAECERACMDSGRPPLWARVLAVLTLGWLGAVVVAAAPRQERELGKDRIFSLPLRVCAGCRPQLAGARALKAALRRVPVYRRLLEKYPRARVSPPAP